MYHIAKNFGIYSTEITNFSNFGDPRIFALRYICTCTNVAMYKAKTLVWEDQRDSVLNWPYYSSGNKCAVLYCNIVCVCVVR